MNIFLNKEKLGPRNQGDSFSTASDNKRVHIVIPFLTRMRGCVSGAYQLDLVTYIPTRIPRHLHGAGVQSKKALSNLRKRLYAAHDAATKSWGQDASRRYHSTNAITR